MESAKPEPMRGVIVGTVVACLAVAMAPWFSGGQEPVAMLASGFALLLAALLLWRQPAVRLLRWGPLAAAFWAFLGWALLSLVWSANRYSTVLWVSQWALAGLAFWVANMVADEPNGRNWLLSAYLWSAVGFCMVALWMFFGGTYGRLTGTFYWANPAAAYLIPAIVLAADSMRVTTMGSGSARRQWLWAVLTVLFLTCFFMTASRAALLVLIFVMIVYALVISVKRKFWINFVFVLIIAFGASWGLSELSTKVAHHGINIVPGSRFAAAAKGESSSTTDRLYFLASALEMWWQHPVLGIGAGTYGDVHPQYQQRVISASASPHNFFVRVLAELGLVGAGILLMLIMFVLAGVLRSVSGQPALVPLFLAVTGVILHFALDIDATYPALVVLVAIMLGLLYRPRVLERRGLSWGLPAAAVALLVPLVSLYLSDMAAIRGAAAQDQGDYPTAAGWYQKAHSGLVYNPDVVSAEGIDLYAVAAIGGKDAKRSAELALKRAREAERLDPHDGQHHRLEGRVLALQGNLPGAVEAFEAALRLDPLNHPEYALDLATVQLRMGNNEQAVQTAMAMVRLYPDSVIRNRSVDETVKPTVSNLWALIGNVRLKQGRMQEAKVASARALALDPEGLQARALQHQVEKPRTQPE